MNGPIKCKAAVCWGENEKLKIEEIEVAPPKHGEVRVKIVASGLCFSDVATLTGKVKSKYPLIAGHEGAGIVESVGDDVQNFKSGDHVLLLFLPQCYKCRVCKAGIGNVCMELLTVGATGLMKDGSTRFSYRGQDVYNFLGTSTFSEYTVVSVNNCVKINQNAPLEIVCLLSCGVPTGYGGAINTANVHEGSTCAIFGLGAIGLATVMGCKAKNASRVIAIDINPDKFEVARTLGATDCINPKDLDIPIDIYLKKNFQGGVDFSFECVGLIETMKQAYDSITFGHGVCVLIGIAPSDKNLEIPPVQVQMGKNIVGSFYGGYKSHDDIPKLVDEYLDGKLVLDNFITHNKSLEDINEAIELLKIGKCIRTVINFGTEC